MIPPNPTDPDHPEPTHSDSGNPCTPRETSHEDRPDDIAHVRSARPGIAEMVGDRPPKAASGVDPADPRAARPLGRLRSDLAARQGSPDSRRPQPLPDPVGSIAEARPASAGTPLPTTPADRAAGPSADSAGPAVGPMGEQVGDPAVDAAAEGGTEFESVARQRASWLVAERAEQPGAAVKARDVEEFSATQPRGEEVRLARAYLMRVAEPPAKALIAFVDAVGPRVAAERVRAAEVPPPVLAETSARRHLDHVLGDFDDAERAGARLIVPEDKEWPAWQLLCLAAAADRGQRWSGAPLGLWVRGTAPMPDAFDRAVSVVGARAASPYGEQVGAEVGYGLAAAGMTVVSGAAFGIDGAAHRGAINADGCTVAVLACGVDKDYPQGHAALLERIADTGLVISEYPPGTPPAKHRFLVRNRIIAALSGGTVVVEAGARSGARNTATTAAALGKVVLAVPGPITSAQSVGCHDLLRTGAAMLAGSVAEILEAVGPMGEHLVDRADGPHRKTDGLGDAALRVHEALRRRTARSTAQVAVESGVSLDRVRALLPELELTGLAERCEEGWRQAPD